MAVIKCFETHVRNTNNIFNKILRIIILFLYIFNCYLSDINKKHSLITFNIYLNIIYIAVVKTIDKIYDSYIT